MKCAVYDLEVICSNPSRIEFKVHSVSVHVVLEPKISSWLLVIQLDPFAFCLDGMSSDYGRFSTTTCNSLLLFATLCLIW